MTILVVDVTVAGGVDTHKHTHYAAAIDGHGRLLGHQEFPATSPGYSALRSWMHAHGNIASIGVESTGSFGAALARERSRSGERVIEVNRPSRIVRRMDGKSDRLDAEHVARAVLGETSPLEESGRRDQATQHPDRRARHQSRAGSPPAPRSWHRDRRTVPRDRWREHRLSRSGDRAANSALHITIVRMRRHGPARTYVERRIAAGLSTREIIRCLKRHIAREICANLPKQRPDNHRSTERFNRTLTTEWAYARPWTATDDRAAGLRTWLDHDNLDRAHLGIKELHPSTESTTVEVSTARSAAGRRRPCPESSPCHRRLARRRGCAEAAADDRRCA